MSEKAKRLLKIAGLLSLPVLAGANNAYMGNNPGILTTITYFVIASICFGYIWFMYLKPEVGLTTIGCGIALLGIGLNTIVMLANNGYMPVLPLPYYGRETIPLPMYIPGGKLLFLGDRLTSKGFSIGDFTMILGAATVGIALCIEFVKGSVEQW